MGVHQGHVTTPKFFTAIIDYMLDQTISKCRLGICLDDKNLTIINFANNIALVVKSRDELVVALKSLENLAAKISVKINWGKAKILPILNMLWPLAYGQPPIWDCQ